MHTHTNTHRTNAEISTRVHTRTHHTQKFTIYTYTKRCQQKMRKWYNIYIFDLENRFWLFYAPTTIQIHTYTYTGFSALLYNFKKCHPLIPLHDRGLAFTNPTNGGQYLHSSL